ncbi:hypothetical protein ACFOSS_01665 [Pseudaeromonas sharmana]|uniref:Uncharacterized protein n=1 Tax=Pseudaeromonas sharmana TaxID=328412 RepID=A0ABV8CJW0_9GAMM
MSESVNGLSALSRDIAVQFRQCHDIEGALALVGLLEQVVALLPGLTVAQQQQAAALMRNALACQERKDWLALADDLTVEWQVFFASLPAPEPASR